MSLKQKIKIILRILKGEEFVPRAEGTAVNDDTIVIIDFIGSLKKEGTAKDFYNPDTGKMEIIYVLSNKEV